MTAENGWKVLSSFHIFHQWYSCQRLYWIHLLPLMVLKIVYTFIHVCHLSVYVWLYFFLDCIICLNSLFHSVWWQSIASEQFGMNWKHSSFAFPTLAHTSPWTTAGPVRLQWSESTHTHTHTGTPMEGICVENKSQIRKCVGRGLSVWLSLMKLERHKLDGNFW